MKEEQSSELDLLYTICFCISADKVLMLFRNKHPNQHKWNGIGGKIELDEHPDASIAREAMEEAGLDLNRAKNLRYVGIVTWTGGSEDPTSKRGMHAYIAEYSPEEITWDTKEINEGMLEWKPLEWVLNKENIDVVENIPFFLPTMLEGNDPLEYQCTYREGKLLDFCINPFPHHLISN